MIRARIWAWTFAALSVCVTPAAAQLLCMGTSPGFLMTIDGGTARFDYLGDGEFELLPPVAEDEVLRSTRTHVLLTAGGRIPVVLQQRRCPVLSITTPVSVEMLVDTDGGSSVFSGCCLLRP